MRVVLIYRWIVFGLGAFFILRVVFLSEYVQVGGPFRFLTVWALFASFFCASRMIALEERRSARRWDGVVGAASVLNLMVVGLYWRLYLTDPASVTGGGVAEVWWITLYLHAVGPALQVIDAVLIHRGFRKPFASAGWLCAIVCAYVFWVELGVQTLNDVPAGRVTSGLPYRFLNDVAFVDRGIFYAINVAMALLILAALTVLSVWLRRRVFAPEAPANPSDSQGI